jgi:hypothetical protein
MVDDDDSSLSLSPLAINGYVVEYALSESVDESHHSEYYSLVNADKSLT